MFLLLLFLQTSATSPEIVTGTRGGTCHVSDLALSTVGTISLPARMFTAPDHTMSELDVFHQTDSSPHHLHVPDASLEALVRPNQILAAVAVGMASDVEAVLDVQRLVSTSASPGDLVPAVQLQHPVTMVSPEHEAVPLAQGHGLRGHEDGWS